MFTRRFAQCATLSLLSFALATSSRLEAQIYDSGTIITAPTGGFALNPASQLENVPPLNLTVFGFNANQTAGFSIADDFTVCGTWAITNLEFLVYQTGGVGPVINGVFVRIWDSDPRSTNPLPTTVWPGGGLNPFSGNLWPGPDVFECYRTVFAPSLATNREVRAIKVPVVIALPTGTYWIEVQFTGTLASGPWVPPITTLGCGKTGNAIQNNSGVYADLVTGTGYGVGLPFRVYGAVFAGSTASANTFGAGSAGLNGVGAWVLGDLAVPVRKPILGSCYPLRLEKGVTGQIPFVFLSTSCCSIPIPCATLLVCPPLFSFTIPAFDTNFESMLCVPIPQGFWYCGVELCLQAFWFDSSISCGYAHSNGLHLVLGD